ncbi:hypothetical protein [Pseudofrankia inefficax]|uniref:Uncharacterized protein n=1 Tax=Pseudofrankia inefficax (strain DSM 45817 / CECT 9037 / DDB 130130 / EuI1c) TaxID=298654 RepID=E3J733_PSEI1|nr:hypothetical protein [Pseudofrankia inefficax]ADP84397.1 hypothetical protein FraEuI1c_6416 [Pseudofrankia inefficax]
MSAADPRLTLALAWGSAVRAADVVSLGLGLWAGRGDWASCSVEARNTAGIEALANIDKALAELAAVRDQIRDEVDRAEVPRRIAADERYLAEAEERGDQPMIGYYSHYLTVNRARLAELDRAARAGGVR